MWSAFPIRTNGYEHRLVDDFGNYVHCPSLWSAFRFLREGLNEHLYSHHDVRAALHSKIRLPLQILESAAGFYIGTANEDGPCSRESVEYWPSRGQAEDAFGTNDWTQKTEP